MKSSYSKGPGAKALIDALTTHDDGCQARSCKHLDNDTSDVDEASGNDRPFASEEVGHVPGNERSEEGTSRQNGDDERCVRG